MSRRWKNRHNFEDFGVDHVHAKLFSMHGTADRQVWRSLNTGLDKDFVHCEGYICSHDYCRADERELAALAQKIRA